ncbi:MAG: hypothetical protein V7695_15465 [Sulfitobacter sp.]
MASCPLTDLSSNKMLHDPRIAALTGCTAALCLRVNGRFGPSMSRSMIHGDKVHSAALKAAVSP